MCDPFFYTKNTNFQSEKISNMIQKLDIQIKKERQAVPDEGPLIERMQDSVEQLLNKESIEQMQARKDNVKHAINKIGRVAVFESAIPLSILYNETINTMKMNQQLTTSGLDMPIQIKVLNNEKKQFSEIQYTTSAHNLQHYHKVEWNSAQANKFKTKKQTDYAPRNKIFERLYARRVYCHDTCHGDYVAQSKKKLDYKMLRERASSLLIEKVEQLKFRNEKQEVERLMEATKN